MNIKFSQQDIQNLCGLSLLPVTLPYLQGKWDRWRATLGFTQDEKSTFLPPLFFTVAKFLLNSVHIWIV